MKNLPLEIQLEGKKKNFANVSVQQVHTKALCEQQKRAKSSTPDSNQNEKLNMSVLWEVAAAEEPAVDSGNPATLTFSSL